MVFIILKFRSWERKFRYKNEGIDIVLEFFIFNPVCFSKRKNTPALFSSVTVTSREKGFIFWKRHGYLNHGIQRIPHQEVVN